MIITETTISQLEIGDPIMAEAVKQLQALFPQTRIDAYAGNAGREGLLVVYVPQQQMVDPVHDLLDNLQHVTSRAYGFNVMTQLHWIE